VKSTYEIYCVNDGVVVETINGEMHGTADERMEILVNRYKPLVDEKIEKNKVRHQELSQLAEKLAEETGKEYEFISEMREFRELKRNISAYKIHIFVKGPTYNSGDRTLHFSKTLETPPLTFDM